MPPRVQPKTFILLLKTHKLTVLITVPSTSTVNDVKAEALDALTSNVLSAPAPPAEYAMDEDPSEWEVPKVTSLDEFELAKAIKEKNRPTGRYEKLEGTAQLKSVVSNWEPIFIQFKDPNGGLLPVKVSIPSIFAEEEEDPALSAARKGKRKAD
ncbi:hypothetical protein C8Q74DRAFT_845936 [Fomes fomentarius]|nr:hypothetical protein C8Q74DRAFT_845936 [Fomes fomentarius]